MKTLFFSIVIFFLLAGCGKKGPLVPPEALVPAAVNNLAVAQKGEYFQLSWSAPTKEMGGKRLADLAGFELFRRQVLPPGEDCEQCPSAYLLLKTVDLEYLQGVERVGNLLITNDNGVDTGRTYQYKVISRKKDGTPSPESNKVRRRKVQPPQPPVVRAVSQATGIILAITPPQETTIVGYNIYRSRQGESLVPLPINDKPVTGTSFEDLRVQRGVTYRYTVRTVATVAGEAVESLPSNEVAGALTEPE
ncbi:lipoprotein [Geotalea sp. SG265]|uniref:LPS translocon maturation chaperone LptM n=1 Tax=Geotalea sp. SG265 TaxID=2922867 RepID=UPI001FAFF433|nr:lipoprotein [Geotalea sp. SG265]